MHPVYRGCAPLDTRCYRDYAMTEDLLMEHAAMGMAGVIGKSALPGSSVLIVSGPGNNGADGIALARLLEAEYVVRLLLPFGAKSPMARLQLERAEKLGIGVVAEAGHADVIVDALFGSGLNRSLDAQSVALIEQMNALQGHKIACDIPSGIGESGRAMPVAFYADITVTMGAHKEALYLDATKEAVGHVHCVDLGVASRHYRGDTQTYVLEAQDLCLPFRQAANTHKGTYGHATILCGEKEGAAILAGSAALRFGAGLVTLVSSHKPALPPYLMHAATVPENTTAIAAGMGLGAVSGSVENLPMHIPLVVDADLFYADTSLVNLLQSGRPLVLTPHPKEFVSLWRIVTGESITIETLQEDRLGFVRAFSVRYPSIVLLLKGAHTLIALGSELWINPLGSAKLSKGGTGDVLSGLIVALLAQGYRPVEAARQASLALMIAGRGEGHASYGMLPTDLIEAVGRLGQTAEK
jgi:ADP-dependent NAD(P)H-hydrate dehydratase / NAD(P)H-hydrate epimerase